MRHRGLGAAVCMGGGGEGVGQVSEVQGLWRLGTGGRGQGGRGHSGKDGERLGGCSGEGGREARQPGLGSPGAVPSVGMWRDWGGQFQALHTGIFRGGGGRSAVPAEAFGLQGGGESPVGPRGGGRLGKEVVPRVGEAWPTHAARPAVTGHLCASVAPVGPELSACSTRRLAHTLTTCPSTELPCSAPQPSSPAQEASYRLRAGNAPPG